jgi:cleavage and polyadenylation specificity factor subunit 1
MVRLNTENHKNFTPASKKKVKNEFNEMTQAGVCRRSNSQWAAPLVPKRKKDGTLQICSDYKSLNSVTTHDRYPLPLLQNFTISLRGKNVFSKIDLFRAFYNIKMFPDHICKTAIITPVGLFKYLKMPFGLKNAAATYQRFMDSILSDLPFVFCYIDDISIDSATLTEHYAHLNTLFQCLNEFNLKINIKKSVFCANDLIFLGSHISSEGFRPTNERIKFFKNMKRSLTISALQKIIGI